MLAVNTLVRTAAHGVLDYLSPPACVGCGAAARWLCRACAFGLDAPPALACPGCGASEVHGRTCTTCRELGSPLDQLAAGFEYERPTLHRLLWTFKESGNREVLPHLTRRLADVAGEHVQVACGDQSAVIPVPALRSRVRDRGFNQAEVLAEPVARALALPLRNDVLVRVKAGRSQKTLGVHDRRSALKNVFQIARTSGSVALPARVVLVDDVATTLATLETCAMVLKAAGVRSVCGVVLAHAQASIQRRA